MSKQDMTEDERAMLAALDALGASIALAEEQLCDMRDTILAAFDVRSSTVE